MINETDAWISNQKIQQTHNGYTEHNVQLPYLFIIGMFSSYIIIAIGNVDCNIVYFCYTMPITNIQVLLFGVQLTYFTAEVHFSCFTDHKEIYEDEFHCQYDILQHTQHFFNNCSQQR